MAGLQPKDEGAQKQASVKSSALTIAVVTGFGELVGYA